MLPCRGRLRTVVPVAAHHPGAGQHLGGPATASRAPPRSRQVGTERRPRPLRWPRPGPTVPRAHPTAHRELIALQGQIVKGKVVRLEEYGAFVEVTTEEGATVTGLVHVSEVSTEFVENIYAELAEGDEVDVKVLDIKDDGKVDLSIKRADPDWQDEESVNLRSKLDKDFNKRLRRFMHKSQMIQGEARRQKRGRVELVTDGGTPDADALGPAAGPRAAGRRSGPRHRVASPTRTIRVRVTRPPRPGRVLRSAAAAAPRSMRASVPSSPPSSGAPPVASPRSCTAAGGACRPSSGSRRGSRTARRSRPPSGCRARRCAARIGTLEADQSMVGLNDRLAGRRVRSRPSTPPRTSATSPSATSSGGPLEGDPGAGGMPGLRQVPPRARRPPPRHRGQRRRGVDGRRRRPRAVRRPVRRPGRHRCRRGARGPVVTGPRAAVDVGTNSVRLLVVDADGRRITRELTITRLGQGVDATGAARPRGAASGPLDTIAALPRAPGSPTAWTDAVRICGDLGRPGREQPGRLLRRRACGRRRRRRGAVAATRRRRSPSRARPAAVDVAAPTAVIDVGGGSTELVVGDVDGAVAASVSLQLGCVRLTERHLHGDPPTEDERRAAGGGDRRPARRGRRGAPPRRGLAPRRRSAHRCGGHGDHPRRAPPRPRRLPRGSDPRRPGPHRRARRAGRPARRDDVGRSGPRSGRCSPGREDVLHGGAMVLAAVAAAATASPSWWSARPTASTARSRRWLEYRHRTAAVRARDRCL